MKDHGPVFPIRDENGNLKYLQQIPQVGMANKLAAMLLRIEQEFGMTPASRADLYVEGRKSGETESIEDFVKSMPDLKIANEIA